MLETTNNEVTTNCLKLVHFRKKMQQIHHVQTFKSLIFYDVDVGRTLGPKRLDPVKVHGPGGAILTGRLNQQTQTAYLSAGFAGV